MKVGLVVAALALVAFAQPSVTPSSRLLAFGPPRAPASNAGSVVTVARARSRPTFPTSGGMARNTRQMPSRRRRAFWGVLGQPVPPLESASAIVAILPVQSCHGEGPSDPPNRRRILEEIQKNPGIHYQELRRRSGAANGDLSYHLRAFFLAGEIIAAKGHGRVHFFASGFRGPTDVHALTDRCQEVLDLVRRHPGTTEAEVMQTTGLGLSWTSEVLRCLQSDGWVMGIRAGHRLRWYPLR